MSTRTPWGKADSVEKVARGILFYGTPSHGGYHLSPTRNAVVHEALRIVGGDRGWYEEDCAYAIVYMTFPEFFPGKVDGARAVVKNWWPDRYTRATGEIVRPEESRILRARIEREKNKDKYVLLAAWGDWHPRIPKGMVGVFAVRGGRLENGQHASGDQAYFIVPEDAERNVIDETKYEKVTPWT